MSGQLSFCEEKKDGISLNNKWRKQDKIKEKELNFVVRSPWNRPVFPKRSLVLKNLTVRSLSQTVGQGTLGQCRNAAKKGRYFMYGDIYCTDFTYLTYTFTLSTWFLVAL